MTRAFLLLVLCLMGSRWAAGQDLTVYDDALENGWQNYSWATVNLKSTAPVKSGTDGISVIDSTSSFQALYLHRNTGGNYRNLVFWIYPTAAGTNQVQVQATLNGAAQSPVKLSFTTGQVNTWQQQTIALSTLGVADNAAFDGFWIQNITGHPLTFYVDEISLTAPPVPTLVQVGVTPSTVIRTIDERIFGLNLAIWDSHLPDGATSAVVSAMKTRVFRWPGGSASDNYDWQTGRSSVNGTFQWTNTAAKFSKLAAEAKAQGCITVNYGRGTPEQAAAWVAYYNGKPTSTLALGVDTKGRDWKTVGYWAALRGAAPLASDDGLNFLRAGHVAPYDFLSWEVGNECYGDWEDDAHGDAGSGLTGDKHDPFTYAAAFAVCRQKMKAVDPRIAVGAVATAGEDSYGVGSHPVNNPNESNSTHTGWTPVMLANLKSLNALPDFLIHHFYAQNPGGESDGGLLESTGRLAQDAANLRKMLTDYAGPAGSGVELAMTELNSVSSSPGKQAVSLVNGLYMADAIGSLAKTEFNAAMWWDLRNGVVTDGNNSGSLYGWRLFGDYGVVASGDRGDTPASTPYPAFYAAKLLTHWGRGGDRVVATASNYPQLAMHGAKLANGNLALLVINKHPAADLTARISYGTFVAGKNTAAWFAYGKAQDSAEVDLAAGEFDPGVGDFSRSFPAYSMTALVITGQWQAWRESKFSTAELADESVSGDLASPAGDGAPNLLKYASGLEPKALASSPAAVVGRQEVAGKSYLTISFTQLPTLHDIDYQVEVSSDLQNWTAGSAAVVRLDDGTSVRAVYRDLTAVGETAQRFIRLAVSRK